MITAIPSDRMASGGYTATTVGAIRHLTAPPHDESFVWIDGCRREVWDVARNGSWVMIAGGKEIPAHDNTPIYVR